MSPIVPVILCGGSGTRLWPRSRAAKPKPFLPLVGDEPLFAAALGRCSADAGFAPPVVVTGASHLEHVEEQLGDSPGAEIIVEPAARNTAAAIALAAYRLPEDAVMLVCPSDHHIGDCTAFTASAHAAAKLAAQGWLVAFGIEPKSPEIGYGYLKRGEPIGEAGGPQGFRVDQFVEKPDLERATTFLEQGTYAWNGGIFAFRVRDFLEELNAFRPAIAAAAREAVAAGAVEGHRFLPDAAAFGLIEGESIDYAVMENTARAAMVPADMSWSDIGNWPAIQLARPRDPEGNSVSGAAELVDCRNVLVETDGPRVSVIGLENVVIVVDGDEVLVTSLAGARKVGKLTGAMRQ